MSAGENWRLLCGDVASELIKRGSLYRVRVVNGLAEVVNRQLGGYVKRKLLEVLRVRKHFEHVLV